MQATRVLPVLVLGAAAVAIGAALELLPHALLYAAKPLATLLIAVYAWRRGAQTPKVRRLVLIALAFSLVGDIALLWPREGFLPGLVAFLFAHLAYIVAFCQPLRFARRPLPFVAYAAVAALILVWLWGGVPAELRAPVLVYVVCLASMAAQAAGVWRAARGGSGERLARRAALGAALFMTSDALLAVDKFAVPLPLAPLAILATYWAAQWCIASSLAPGQPHPGH